MQFYRKWINVNQDNYIDDPNNQIMMFFKQLGFVQLDGSEYTLQDQAIRWRYDNWQTTSRKYIWWSKGGYTVEPRHRFAKWYQSDGTSYDMMSDWTVSLMNFFIGFPLKNRGFYLMNGVASNGHFDYGVYMSTDYPPRLIKPHTRIQHNYLQFPYILSGFYNNLVNEFNYLFMWASNQQQIDCNYSAIKGVTWDSSGSYTDGKKNICTLIKYPTQDGFMDNLYLISTSPNTVTDGYSMSNKFFSFGGRNFYCSDYNLVFELPAN